MYSTDKWKTFLEELTDPDLIDVSSLKLKTTLTSELWEDNQLKPEIGDALYRIAKEFFETLQLPTNITLEDVTLTGSLATYNWSDLSDVDLHLLIDFSKLENRELMEDYFKEKSRNWNRTHQIQIKGYEVEIYVQDSSEPHLANGIYSLLNDRWIKEPSRFRTAIDFETVKKKAAGLMEAIDEVYEQYAEKNYRQALKAAENLMDRIRKYRRCGLKSGGINSVENLAFKILRRNDYLQKLSSLKILAYDRLMSVNGS
jgi:hypothetical protein